jgi:hypothetical protein
MKKVKLHTLKDNQHFTLSNRNLAVIYVMQKNDRKRKVSIFTSCRSKRTYEKPWNTICYLITDTVIK